MAVKKKGYMVIVSKFFFVCEQVFTTLWVTSSYSLFDLAGFYLGF
jgi:hypothetical protein